MFSLPISTAQHNLAPSEPRRLGGPSCSLPWRRMEVTYLSVRPHRPSRPQAAMQDRGAQGAVVLQVPATPPPPPPPPACSPSFVPDAHRRARAPAKHPQCRACAPARRHTLKVVRGTDRLHGRRAGLQVRAACGISPGPTAPPEGPTESASLSSQHSTPGSCTRSERRLEPCGARCACDDVAHRHAGLGRDEGLGVVRPTTPPPPPPPPCPNTRRCSEGAGTGLARLVGGRTAKQQSGPSL